jgi:ribosomal protein L37AE/L43A
MGASSDAMASVEHPCDFCGRTSNKQMAVNQRMSWICDSCSGLFLAGHGAGVTAAKNAAMKAGATQDVLDALKKL